MLRERNQTFKLMFIGLDLVLAALSYLIAVVLHFYILSPERREFVVPVEAFEVFAANAAIGTTASLTRRESACQTASKPHAHLGRMMP